MQWLLYTDFDPAPAVPPNVALKPLQLDALGARAAEALGTAVDFHKVRRKVCDLKPAYGLIFEDDLRGFDFWAHSDLDVVWGHVRGFMTDSLLETTRGRLASRGA
ncbi:MAG: hypothetical protein FJW14_04400 [Acidimicrobiia bacterium]|nr:hypothetical protein [Acidimicrobiia bacterium]